MNLPPSPSHSPEAEQVAIGCTFLDDGDFVARATTAGLSPSDFFDPRNAQLFALAADLAAAGKPTTIDAVAEELRERGQLEPIGGFAYLAQVSTTSPTSAEGLHAVEKIQRHARARALTRHLRAALEIADRPGSWAELAAAVAPHLTAAATVGEETAVRSLAVMAAQAAAWRTHPDTRPAIPTPWPRWDAHAGAPRGGELIVIAGRPGTGKTTLAGNIAADLAAAGRHAAFFSLEMSGEELLDRFALRRAGRPGLGFDTRANATVAREIEAIGQWKTLHLHDAADGARIEQIEARCRLLAARPGGLAAVVVDYLQLVTPPADTRREIREQQVAAMSRRFKLLARALGCPVFLLAQLNRETEREQRRPRTSDLRESGAIEQDADRVWLLYAPPPPTNAPLAAPDESAPSRIPIMLLQAKCRNGPQGGIMQLAFDRPLFSFTHP